MMDYNVSGRTVLITGGASGIGRALVHAAADQGMRIAIVDSVADSAAELAVELTERGVPARSYVGDVRDRPFLASTVVSCEEELGPLWAAVAVAGISRPAPSAELSADDWASVLDVNLTGVFNTVQATAAPMLKRGEGSIVVVGSTNSFGGQEHRANYSASKHGVLGLVRSVAIDWGQAGVRVNLVAPGAIDTPLLRANHTDEQIRKRYLSRIPLSRLSTTEEQASAILFLISDASRYMTGSVITVDGGLSAGYLTSIDDDH